MRSSCCSGAAISMKTPALQLAGSCSRGSAGFQMYHSYLLLCLGVLVKWAAGGDWCYTGCAHTPTKWADLPGSSCGGESQSPIDIVTNNVLMDPNLLNFTFDNMSRNVKSIINDGHTVKCTLEENAVTVSGGGLNDTYSTMQLHFHWGDTEYHPGSEHMIDGKRYPMEMHIVNLKKGLPLEQAMADPRGIAVLGFLINATDDGVTSGPWSVLTSYLTNVTGTVTPVNKILSINDLIGNIDLTKFYRYTGSLTTPNCTEAVVWTVFHDTININKNLIQQFPTRTGLTNVYRPAQALNNRQVFASPATPLPPSHPWCYHHCEYSASRWNLLPHTSCGGSHQSPVNIETHNVVMDKRLDAVTCTGFDNKSAINSITNTGHTVVCGLEKDTVEVSGGGLGFVYSTLQLHFHWASALHSGSEHTLDSKRYPMEMHIVSKRKDLTLDKAMSTPNGMAVLGFFIEANPTLGPTSVTNAWKVLTSYLSDINKIESKAEVAANISIDDLLGSVNRADYYRYSGSLTTPSCNEAVVWTVFKESIKVDQNLIMMFPNQMRYFPVFRPTQPLNGRKIFATRSSSSATGPNLIFLLLTCLCFYIYV